MDQEYVAAPRIVKEKEKYEKGANVPTHITVHKCLCGWGRIEHHRVPGFDDDWFEIKCLFCKLKYHPFIDQVGDEWLVTPKRG